MNGMAPSFELADGGILLALARSSTVLALFSAYGTLIFRVFVADRVYARMPARQGDWTDRQLGWLAGCSLAAAAAGLIAWLVIEAGAMADAEDFSARIEAIRPVLSETVFGHIIALQLFVMAIVGAALLKKNWRLAAACATITILLEAGHGHALAISGSFSLLILSECVHLLSAGAWLGGLMPLAMVVYAEPAAIGAAAARHFTPLGKLSLYGLVGSAAVQAWYLVGGIDGLSATAYGWIVILKALIFTILFGFAVANRYWLAIALSHDKTTAAKNRLVASIALQTGFGIAVVMAAGLLASLPPGTHPPHGS